MFPEFSDGTFLSAWFNSWAGVHGMAISLVIAVLAFALTK